MNRTRAKLAAALLLAAPAVVLMAGAPRPLTDLRVCADPFDLPFSNDQEQGFENKIAHVVAQDLNARVVNYWWPSRRGVLRNSILGGFCDVMIQAPVGLDPVATTKPYYRSTYYFVFRADRARDGGAPRLGSRLGHAVRVQHGDGRAAPRQGAQGTARFRDRSPQERDHRDSAGVQRSSARPRGPGDPRRTARHAIRQRRPDAGHGA